MRPDELLLQRIKARLPELEELHIEVTSHWKEEDAVYRYYHGSFKVYSIQDCIKQIVALFQELGDGSKLNGDFPKIIEAGTDIKFDYAHNSEWDKYPFEHMRDEARPSQSLAESLLRFNSGQHKTHSRELL
jgi:hypothetical protein